MYGLRQAQEYILLDESIWKRGVYLRVGGNIMTKLSTILQLLIFIFISSCSAQHNSYDKAKELIKQNDFKDGLEILNNVISQNPTFDSAYIQRAYCFSKLGDIKSSLADYNHAMANPSLKISA